MNELKYGKFVSHSFKSNSIFDLTHPWNRDNCFQPYVLLREILGYHDIEVNTSDIEVTHPAAFDLHLDVQPPDASRPSYLLMLETPQVHPPNGNPRNWNRYRKIFTWNDELVDSEKFIKINFPNPVPQVSMNGFRERDRFCCLISSNRSLDVEDDRILYPERVRTIRWFEQHAPNDFDLYGIGWDIPASRPGLAGRIENRFWRALKRIRRNNPFPSYRGTVEQKREVLCNTRYSICYENICNLPGYITEKIFDCFFSGCVPVYWGANNVADHIPADCFIDRRQFDSTDELYRFLKSRTESDFEDYQASITAFLSSDRVYPFTADYFANTITCTLVQDLGSQA